MRYTASIKENRLFRRLYGTGKCAADPFLAVYCLKSRGKPVRSADAPPSPSRNRLGLTVGVKVGKAVVRNKVRRRLREIYRLAEPRMQTGWDIVIVARTRAADADYKTLERSAEKLFTRLKLLREQPAQEKLPE